VWINGKREGVSRLWHENGKLWAISNWKDGKRDGETVVWRTDGSILRRNFWKNGIKQGSTTEWFDTEQSHELSSRKNKRSCETSCMIKIENPKRQCFFNNDGDSDELEDLSTE
jgi:antitoxin component YwqK of YwqJK toxin-antitoxin module